MPKITPWAHNIDAAIAEARRRRVVFRQHFAVVQACGDSLTIRNYSEKQRAVWTTRDDIRGSNARITHYLRTLTTLEAGDIQLMRQLRSEGMVYRDIAEKFEVSVTTAQRVVSQGHYLDDRS